MLFIFIEFSFRAYFAFSHNNTSILIKPVNIIENAYPKLIKTSESTIPADNHEIDILLLGGSVIHKSFGNIEAKLRNQLQAVYKCNINIDNLAYPGHTSLDSRNKYRYIENHKYDLIFIYHGINEFRFNNCPKSVFKNDYSHIEFYNLINYRILKMSAYSVIPYMLNHINVAFQKLILKKDLLPNNYINQNWIQYGGEVKTLKPFQENYRYIIKKALENKSRILISSFGYYASGEDAIDSLKVLNAPHEKIRIPSSIWGKKKDIVNGIEAHNKIIKELSNQYNGDYLNYIDLESQLIKDNDHFVDMCHLTESAAYQFVELIMPEVKKSIDAGFHCG